jgi:hypothetical protein
MTVLPACCWILAVLSLGVATVHAWDPSGVGWLALAVAGAWAGLFPPKALGRRVERYTHAPIAVATVASLAQVAAVLRRPPLFVPTPPPGVWIYRGAAAAIILAGVLTLRRSGRTARMLALLTVLVAAAWIGAWTVQSDKSPAIDVYLISRMASDAVLHGDNPYRLRMPDIYGEAYDYYGPGWVTAERGTDGSVRRVVTTGYVYPPALALLSTLGHAIFGDYRYALLACLLSVAALTATLRQGMPARNLMLAVLLLTWPTWPVILEMGWTDVAMAAALACTVWAAMRRPRWLFLPLGLFIATKQYGFLALPLTALLLPRPLPWRVWAVLLAKAAGVAAAVTLPLVLWDPSAAWRSLVLFQVAAPFRPDSLAFPALIFRLWHVQPSAVAGFAAFGVVAAAALWKAPRTPAAFAGAVGCAYLCFFAFGKQAFMNYYLFCMSALVLAASAVDDGDRSQR